MPAHPLGYTNHPLSPWTTGVWQKRVSLPPGPFCKVSPTLCLFLFSSVLLHTKVGSPAAACPIPTGLTHKVCSAAGKSLSTFWPVSRRYQVLPLDMPQGLYSPERDKESVFIATVGLRRSSSKAMWKLVEEFVQNWCSRLSALWVSPKFEFVQVPALVCFVTSQHCVVKIPLCASFHPVLHHFPAWLEASLPCWSLSFPCPGLSIALKLLSLSEECLLTFQHTPLTFSSKSILHSLP